MPERRRKATIFLDRDGVLIEDVHLLTEPDQVRLLAGAAEAVGRLRTAGFAVVLVSNQPVVSRGLASETAVDAVHRRLGDLLRAEAGTSLDAVHYCPHHPNATLPEYRRDCDCRKPRPGLLIRAAEQLGLPLDRRSFMVGDRVSDVLAGRAAGCTTVQVLTGRHVEPPIESPDPIPPDTRADHECESLAAAVEWILAETEAQP